MEMAGDVMKGVRGSTTVLTITVQSLSDLDVQVSNQLPRRTTVNSSYR